MVKSWIRKKGRYAGEILYRIRCRECNRRSVTSNREKAEEYEYTCKPCRAKTGKPMYARYTENPHLPQSYKDRLKAGEHGDMIVKRPKSPWWQRFLELFKGCD